MYTYQICDGVLLLTNITNVVPSITLVYVCLFQWKYVPWNLYRMHYIITRYVILVCLPHVATVPRYLHTLAHTHL